MLLSAPHNEHLNSYICVLLLMLQLVVDQKRIYLSVQVFFTEGHLGQAHQKGTWRPHSPPKS